MVVEGDDGGNCADSGGCGGGCCAGCKVLTLCEGGRGVDLLLVQSFPLAS